VPSLADILDPIAAYSFHVELDGITLAQFQEVSGLGITITPIEVKQQSLTSPMKLPVLRKVPGQVSYNDITLKRGRIVDHSFWNWMNDARSGKLAKARKSGSIIVWDYEQGIAGKWTFQRAWPTKVDVSRMAANADEVLVETIVLCVDYLEWEGMQ
jgi:phage tail-like protein